MLRIIERHGAAETERYFRVALAVTDYYARERGTWGGRVAARLGLSGNVQKEDFMALANNKVSGKGKRLTARLKEDWRSGYDFCFAAPKSVSVYLAETEDKEVERMIQRSFEETMADIESRMETRVRIGGADRDRFYGKLGLCVLRTSDKSANRRDVRPALSHPRFHV
jgi:conjugative relaxase-like TrwC/TraI family protein